MLGCPPDATPSLAYLGASPWPEPTTALFTLWFYNAALKTSKFTYNKTALPPHQFTGPAAPNLACALPQHPPAVPVPVGSSIKWNGQSLTMGC